MKARRACASCFLPPPGGPAPATPSLRREGAHPYGEVKYTDHGKDFDQIRTQQILLRKCRFKNLPDPKTEDFFGNDRLVETQRFWVRGLAHQLTDVPPFE